MGWLRFLCGFVAVGALGMSFEAAGGQNPYNVVLVPSSPVAGQSFIIRWDAPNCLDVRSLRSASLSGGVYRVAVEFIPPLPGLPGCTPGVLVRHEWTVGPLPAGNYTFELSGIHPMFNTNEGVLAEFPFGVVVFVPASPNVVPVDDPLALAWLASLLGLGAVLATRSRGRGV